MNAMSQSLYGSWRTNRGGRTSVGPLSQTNSLPAIASGDWEQIDQDHIERTFRKMYSTAAVSFRQPVQRSMPDLHAGSYGRLSQESAAYGSSPSKQGSVPVLPSVAASPKIKRGTTGLLGVFMGSESDPEPVTPVHNSSSKESSPSSLVMPSDSSNRRTMLTLGSYVESCMPTRQDSGTPHNASGTQEATEQSCIGDSPKTLKTHCPQEMDGWEAGVPSLMYISKKWSIPYHDLKVSCDLFCEYAVCSDKKNVLRDGRMSIDDFYKIVCKMTDSDSLADLHHTVMEEAFQTVDVHKQGLVNFWEFAVWHDSMAFAQCVVLTKAERRIRTLCKKVGISAGEMDKYESLFNKFDLDATGLIEYPEFCQMMRLLMKVGDLQIPEKRFEHFWYEADKNSNGTIDLEEFVVFYVKNFDVGAVDPIASFYHHFLPPPLIAIS